MTHAPDVDTPGELVRRFCAGDTASVAALMGIFRPVVVRAARRYVYSDHDVDDVLQETWIAFVAHAGAIREPERVVGWLRATALNVGRRLAVRNARLDLVDHNTIDQSVPSFEDEVATLAVDEARRRAFEQAVDQLSITDQKLVRLLVDERALTYESIGTIVERPLGSIGPTRARLIDKLRRHPLIKAMVAEATSSDPSEFQPTALTH